MIKIWTISAPSPPSLRQRQANRIAPHLLRRQSLFPARAINHSDEEMEMLAALVRQRTAWQITGVKGSRDGSGHQYEKNPRTTDDGSYGNFN